MVSLILICHNQQSLTEKCLNSVLRHTIPPYELILVDNGSTDGTLALLQSVAQQLGPQHATVLQNTENRGYVAACNQALAKAQGEFILLLNNDTLVTPHWLDGLLQNMADPTVGLVGPMSNQVPAPQCLSITDLADRSLDTVAHERRSRFARQALPAQLLSGFCVLVRRAVFNQIGPLDEQFDFDSFSIDDLCFRAADAGWKLRVALDVYIHHWGGHVAQAAQIKAKGLFDENVIKFQKKWGVERAASYQLQINQLSAIPAEVGNNRAKVSLCMIVKNEEHHLPDCLRSVIDLVDEAIVVDTGSSDCTKEIAASFGAKVFDFPWIDSFSAARNESLRHATGDFAFWMDADDRLDAANRRQFQEEVAGLRRNKPVGLVMKCRCTSSESEINVTVVDHVRLFPLRPEIRWHYRVHEQILPSLRQAGIDVRWADVAITHIGYQDSALRSRKLERDLRLLQLDHQEQGDEPFILFNLGSIYQELGNYPEAIRSLQRSLEMSHPADSIVRKIFALLTHCHQRMGDFGLAFGACKKGREFYPDDSELLFIEANLCRANGDLQAAAALLERLLTHQEGAHFASVDGSLRGTKARHNLAIIYQEMGRHSDAQRQLDLLLMENPRHT